MYHGSDNKKGHAQRAPYIHHSAFIIVLRCYHHLLGCFFEDWHEIELFP